MAREFFKITGINELDTQLQLLAGDRGPKSVKKALRQACRKAMKEVMLPASRAAVPVRTGALRRSLTVRAAKFRNPRNKVGYSVVVRPKAFESGDNYYPAFIEYGTKERAGGRGKVESTSYLRVPLDRNANKIRAMFAQALRDVVNKAFAETSLGGSVGNALAGFIGGDA